MSRPLIPVTLPKARRLALICAVIVALLVGVVLLLALAARFIRASGIEDRLERIETPALIAAGTTAALWLALLGAIRWVRRPRQPRPGTRPLELGRDLPELGPEPPAVAGLLTNDFDLRRDALPATLLDLASRRIVELDGIGPEVQVRLRGGADEGSLLPYERRVLGLVRGWASGGVVPAAALTSGPRDHARRWWRGFRNEVIDDAQARGLSRDLWDRRALWVLSIAALIPAAFSLLGTRDWGAPVAVLVGTSVVVALLRERREQRDTDPGLEAGGRWLDVRRFLQAGDFPDLPPAAVAIWERYLAYAAAFGVARNAIRAFPMGAEEDRSAWSTFGGRWREVRVRYPLVWPPAWGWLPGVALLAAVAGILAASGLLRLGSAIGWPDPSPGLPAGFITLLRGLAVAARVAGSLMAVWSAVTLVRSIGDLGRARTVDGQVLRLRTFGKSSRGPGRHYLALDDGTSDTVRAWRVPDELWISARVGQYRPATVMVTPFLGRVRSIVPS